MVLRRYTQVAALCSGNSPPATDGPEQLCSPPIPAPLGLSIGIIHQLVKHHVQIHILPVLSQLADCRPDLLFREPHRGHLLNHVVDGHSGSRRATAWSGPDWRSLG